MSLQPTPDRMPALLLEIIHFKWLMAGAGHRVHVERMQSDLAYAQQCLVLGAGAKHVAVRDGARHLAQTLGLALPH